jgi:transcriptional regulator with XRE-family HTH domain
MSVALHNDVLSFNMNHPLGRWRWRHQMSQKTLSERCGLSQQMISAIESGERTPSADALKRLHEVTGLPLEALLYPTEYLQANPDFLTAPPRGRTRGRPRKPRLEEGSDA